jgi:hypothetical protein
MSRIPILIPLSSLSIHPLEIPIPIAITRYTISINIAIPIPEPRLEGGYSNRLHRHLRHRLPSHVDREPHSSLPPSLEDHPFLRNHGSITTISSIMGQVQTRGSHELEAAPSSGPDPTVFRQHPRYPNVQIAMPPVPRAPPMQQTKTDETYSPIDYAPPPAPQSGPLSAQTRPNPTGFLNGGNSFGSRSKGMVRKLSRKGPPAPIVTKKSMGPDPFEARPFSPLMPMEAVEGLKTKEEIGQEYGGRTVKAGTFPLRQVVSPNAQTGTLASPLPMPSTSVPSPSSTSGPAMQAAGVHRRVSSMTRSPRLSIRSSPSKRAEREWRAKVAGLAHTHRAATPGVETRGPVPPKRQAYVPPALHLGDRDRSSSPEEEALVTPVGSMPSSGTAGPVLDEQNTPAKSIVSNKSFETLGHHAHAHLSPTRGPVIASSPGRAMLSIDDPGVRQCSVPQSVVSSFYFDQRASRVSTHLSPLNTLSPLPATGSPSPDSPLPGHKASLPPFESFTRSPAAVGPPPSPTPTPFASPMVYPSRLNADVDDLNTVPPLSLSKSGTSKSSCSIDNRSSLPLHPLIIGHNSRSKGPVSPGPKTPIRQPRPVTVSTPKSSCPATPYSPTTNYILHSHSDQIDQHLFAGNGDFDLSLSWSDDQNRMMDSASSHAAHKHPYARTPSMLIDSPPRKPRQVTPLCPRREVVSPPCRHVPSFQSHSTSHSYSQQTKPHRGIKAEIIGSGNGRQGGGTVLSGKRVDLTPGMDTGLRPPKSGLPVSVSLVPSYHATSADDIGP